MKVYKYTNKGQRENNQDFIDSKLLDKQGDAIFVVADGMGGYSHGEIASKVVTDEIIEFISENIYKKQPSTLLKQAFANANEMLFTKRLSLNVAEMGCVVVALLIVDRMAYIAWIGDSRLYFFRNGQQVYVTTNHTISEELSYIKTLKLEEIEKYSSIVTKAIMGDEKYENPDMIKTKIQEGDTFILCTDGLYKQNPPQLLLVQDEGKLDDLLDSRSIDMKDNYSLIKITI